MKSLRFRQAKVACFAGVYRPYSPFVIYPDMTTDSEIISIIKTVLKHKGLADVDVNLSSQLYEDGLGLDSLSVAELSAALEKAFGKDPYTSGQLPLTVEHIVEFYAAS